MRTGLVLPYMMGLDVISFSIRMSLLFFFMYNFDIVFFFLFIIFQQKKKKKLGKKMRNFIFSFDIFSNIACVFA
jgi:hypothetical protein